MSSLADDSVTGRPTGSGTEAKSTSAPPSVFLGALIDELLRLGVHDVVISPGSRSTPLAMVFERSDFNLYVDIDERGAAFFGLGLAKAAKRPVCLLCTSGTAAANYYPAICEAAAARVPLIVMTADRPHDLRGLGATQTTDQLKMFGDMTVFFHEMPLPDGSPEKVAFARQIARESVIRATGVPNGPVHLNFPFAEPLIPDLSADGLFSMGRRAEEPLIAETGCSLSAELVERLNVAIAGKRGVILCGEGDYPAQIVDFARRVGFPILADPLSNLRQFADDVVIDNYDNIFRRRDLPAIDVAIRLGQYPVSKALFTAMKRLAPFTIVVDQTESRDFNHLTDMFVRAEAGAFVLAAGELGSDAAVAGANMNDATAPGGEYLATWARMNAEEAAKIGGANCAAGADGEPSTPAAQEACDGSYVLALIDEIADGSLLWAANSMSIRYLDTFYLKRDKAIHVMCNRGLNGIDGTLSSALGAAECFETTTLLTGDLAFLHDLTALHLQRELDTNLTVVLLNNGGGGIFEMLPQKSAESYFQRLFLTPQSIDFGAVAEGFGVPFTAVDNVSSFVTAYRRAQTEPGIKVIEVRSDISELKEQYLKYC